MYWKCLGNFLHDLPAQLCFSSLTRHQASSFPFESDQELHASFKIGNINILHSPLSSVQLRLRFRKSCLSCAVSSTSMISFPFKEVVKVSLFGQSSFLFHLRTLHTLPNLDFFHLPTPDSRSLKAARRLAWISPCLNVSENRQTLNGVAFTSRS